MTTDLVKRKPNQPPPADLVTSRVPVALTVMALQAVAALMHLAVEMLSSHVALVWAMQLFARSAMPLNRPMPRCAVWPCKPMVKPWCMC